MLTAPLLFVLIGLVLGSDAIGLHFEIGHSSIHLIAEVTLILVLFGDASRIDLRALKSELGIPVRLLLIAMPLTIAFGGGVAYLIFPGLGIAQAFLVGAILAPTDAALGQSVVSSPVVPKRIRQGLNVESGLNDGIAVPIILLLLCLASAQTEGGRTATEWVWFAAKQLSLGPATGILVGFVGSALLTRGKEQDWFSESLERLLGVIIAIIAFTGAETVGGNGFIAAFLGGMVMGNRSRNVRTPVYEFLEAEGQLVSLLVFLLLGATLAWPVLEHVSPKHILYALASLTVIRLFPTALSLIGAKLRPSSVLFLGWFGPRGLASILFAMVALEEGTTADPHGVFTIVIITVLLSVLLHGITASPLSEIYGRAMQREPKNCKEEHKDVFSHPTRRRESK